MIEQFGVVDSGYHGKVDFVGEKEVIKFVFDFQFVGWALRAHAVILGRWAGDCPPYESAFS